MTSSIERVLSGDHRAIDALYDAYLEARNESSVGAAESFRTYKLTLLRHIKCEEDLIFPLLRGHPEIPASREVAVLRDEHRRLIPLLMEVEKQLKDGVDPAASERRLAAVLREHNEREESRVYGALDGILTDSQMVAVREALASVRLFC